MKDSKSTAHQLGSLPTGWCAFTDAVSLRTYYAHIPTGDVRWDRPPNPPPPPPLPTPGTDPQLPLQVRHNIMRAQPQTFPSADSRMPPPPPPQRADQAYFPPPIQNQSNYIPPSASFRCSNPFNAMYQTPRELSIYSRPSPDTSNQYPQHLPFAPILSRSPNVEHQGRKRTPTHDQSHRVNHITCEGEMQKGGNAISRSSKRARCAVSTSKRHVESIVQDGPVKKCSKCHNQFERKDFSPRQWTLSEFARKCYRCQAVGKTSLGIAKEMVAPPKNGGKTLSATPSTLPESKQAQVGLETSIEPASRPQQSQGTHLSIEQPSSASRPSKSPSVAPLDVQDNVHLPSPSNQTIDLKKIKQEDDDPMNSGSKDTCLDLSSNQLVPLGNKSNGKQLPNPHETKTCSACKKNFSRDLFYRKQWTSPALSRKCRQCIEGEGSKRRRKSSKTTDCASCSAATANTLRSKETVNSNLQLDAVPSSFNGGVQIVTSAIIKTEKTTSSDSMLKSANTDLLASAAATNTSVPDTVSSSLAARVSTKTSKTSQNTRVDRKVCSICKQLYNYVAFTKTQWRAKDKSRKCSECGVLRKLCHVCKQRFNYEAFTNYMWQVKGKRRKCIACANKK